MHTDIAFEKIRILVVDDDTTMHELIAASIGSLGAQIHAVESAESALQLIEQERFDLFLLDRMLPGIQGPELCAMIRERDWGEFAQILMLTAEDSIEARLRCFDCGADDFVAKPFHYKELYARVKAQIRVQALSRTLAEQNEVLLKAREQLKEGERLQALADIAATAAHELGQPISAILLNLHLLRKLTPEEPMLTTAVTSIESDVKRLADLTTKLRDIKNPNSSLYLDRARILKLDRDNSDSESD